MFIIQTFVLILRLNCIQLNCAQYMRTPCKHLFDWVQIDCIQLNCALYFWCKHLFYWVQIDWAQLNSVWLNMPAYLHISSRNCRVLICDYAVWFLCANWRMNNVNIRVTLFGNNFTFVRLKLHIVGENGADFRQNIYPVFFLVLCQTLVLFSNTF